MKLSLPSKTAFHTIERTIKEYRKFAQKNISNKLGDITLDQGMVLLFLNSHPSLTQKEIAALVFRDNASMTRIINLMVQKEFLTRTINESDRRRFNLEITKKGHEVLNILPPIIAENRNAALNGVTENELSELDRILCKITYNIKQQST